MCQNLSYLLYTKYPIVARALGLAAARAKVSCIQSYLVRIPNYGHIVYCQLLFNFDNKNQFLKIKNL